MVNEAAYRADIEKLRADARARLRGPTSVLAAIARHELPVGSRLRFGRDANADVALAGAARSVEIAALPDGFTVDGQYSGPTQIELGRYRLRLSHQNYPAVVVLDAQSPRLAEDVQLRWWPIDPALRIRGRLQPDGARTRIGSTASAERDAERVGWLAAQVGGESVRLLVTRLLEPGAEGLDVYFRDATTGKGSYEVGRYVSVERDGDDFVVDFNRAYNPSCALSPFYNCPIPPRENHLSVPIRAGETDKVLGVIPSVARSLFVMGIVLSAVVVAPVSVELKAAIETSRLARTLIERIAAVQPQLASLSGQVSGDQVPLFVTKLGEDDTQRLDLPDGIALAADPAAERQMFALVNEERANAGVGPLVWDDRLVPVARAHSEEMFRLKYFSHQSPVSGSPFDRLKAAGITYQRAGENLAYAQSVTIAHRGLMQSEGHRENILRPEFTRLGIGVVSGGPYGRMFTQM